MPSAGFAPVDKMCGVGITFVEDNTGALFVKSLVPGGSAAQSEQVQVPVVVSGFRVSFSNHLSVCLGGARALGSMLPFQDRECLAECLVTHVAICLYMHWFAWQMTGISFRWEMCS